MTADEMIREGHEKTPRDDGSPPWSNSRRDIWRRLRHGLADEEQVAYSERMHAGTPEPSERQFRREKRLAWLYAALWVAAAAAVVIWLEGWLVILGLLVLVLVTPDTQTLFRTYDTQREEWEMANRAP